EFLFSPLKVMVISGAYGMGKTFVARYLAALITEKTKNYGKRIPIVIDSYRLTTDVILSEVTRQVRDSTDLDIREESIRSLLHRDPSVIFFDALDQLPYRAGANNRLDAILDFVERLTSVDNSFCKSVLVVLNEF